MDMRISHGSPLRKRVVRAHPRSTSSSTRSACPALHKSSPRLPTWSYFYRPTRHHVVQQLLEVLPPEHGHSGSSTSRRPQSSHYGPRATASATLRLFLHLRERDNQLSWNRSLPFNMRCTVLGTTLNSSSRCTESSASTAFVVGSTTQFLLRRKYGRNFLFYYYYYYYYYYTSFYRYSTLYEELVCFRARSGHSAIHVQESFQELMNRRGQH